MDGGLVPSVGEASPAPTRAALGPAEAYSARRLLTWPQTAAVAALFCAAAAGAAHAPRALGIVVNIALTAYFIAAIAFRLRLTLAGYLGRECNKARAGEPAPDAVPIVTILLPLNDEAESLPTLFGAIAALDYPRQRLDIKILLEAGDEATIAAARDLPLAAPAEILIVPSSGPRTKPNACNYGLLRARGELLVIYDAEDIPDKDQIAKAARRFAEADGGLACLQARLRFYNADENWLTRGIMAQTPREMNPLPAYLSTHGGHEQIRAGGFEG